MNVVAGLDLGDIPLGKILGIVPHTAARGEARVNREWA